MIRTLKKIAVAALANPAIRRTYNATTRAALEVGGSTRAGATMYSA